MVQKDTSRDMPIEIPVMAALYCRRIKYNSSVKKAEAWRIGIITGLSSESLSIESDRLPVCFMKEWHHETSNG